MKLTGSGGIDDEILMSRGILHEANRTQDAIHMLAETAHVDGVKTNLSSDRYSE